MNLKKLICKLLKHKWNKYSLKSSYGKKLCKRCGYEEKFTGVKSRTLY